MVATSLLTGGSVYLGYKAYNLVSKAERPVWWQSVVTRLHKLRTQVLEKGKAATVVNLTNELPNMGVAAGLKPPTTKQSLATSVTALGIATASSLYYPPLRLLCIPAFLYLGVAPTSHAYDAWRQEGHITLAVAESAFVVLCVVQGAFLVGSVGFSLYYLGQVIAEVRRQEQVAQMAWQPPLWAWRRSGDGNVVALVKCLQVGDTVVVHAGEMVPLDSVVTEGVAWVRLPGQLPCGSDMNCAAGLKVSPGHKVTATTIVLVGTIDVAVIELHS